MVNRYIVGLEGRGFLVSLPGEPLRQRLGFLTWRCVEAATPDDAIAKATSLVRSELESYGNAVREVESGSSIVLDELHSVESFQDGDEPGAGFTWFPED